MTGDLMCTCAAAAVLVVLSACDGSNSGPFSAPPDVLTAVRELSLGDPVATFGNDTGLSSIRAAALLSTGGVVLVDSKAGVTVEYDPESGVRRVLGGRGEGPGEFMTPTQVVVLPGDTVVVYDARNGRLTYFAPDHPEPVVETLSAGMFGRPPRMVWRIPDGTLLTYEGDIRSSYTIKSGREGSVVGPEAVIRRVDPETGSADTLHSGSVAEETIQVGSMYLAAAFGRSTYVDVNGQITAIALPDGFAIQVYENGDPQYSVSLPEAVRPLEHIEVSRMRDSIRQLAAVKGAPFMAGPIFERELLPELRPSFSGIVAGPDGRVLLREFAPFGRHADTWWLVDPTGAVKGRVRLPDVADVMEVGLDYLLVLRRNSMDVPRLELHRVNWATLDGG